MQTKRWLVLCLDIAVCLLCAVGATIAVTRLFAWVLPTGQVPTLKSMGIWAVIGVLLLQNTLILAYANWRAGEHRTWLWGDAPVRFGHILVYSAVAVPLVLVVNIVVGAVFYVFGMQHNQSALYPLTAGDTLGQIGFFAVAVVLVPVAEEVLFRGYIYGRVARLSSPGVAIVSSAVIFAAAHTWSASSGSIALVVQTCALGLVLGWIRSQSQSTFPSMVAHALNNAVALLLVISCVNHPELGCART
jgi:membrane protease YdiL (CAAX protease family)